MWHVGSQVQELKKLVLQNKEALVSLRTNFDKPDVMKDLAKRLVQVDSVLQVRRFIVNLFITKTLCSGCVANTSLTERENGE